MKSEILSYFPVVNLYVTLEKINRTKVRDMFLLKLAEEYGTDWYLKRDIANIAIELILIADEFRAMNQSAQQMLFHIALEQKEPVSAIWPVTVPFERKFSKVQIPSQVSERQFTAAWNVIYAITRQSFTWQGFITELNWEKRLANSRNKAFDEAQVEIELAHMPEPEQKVFLELLMPTNTKWKN